MSRAAVLEDLDWGQDARDAIEQACKRGGSFTADDLRDAGLRDAPRPSMWGAAFKSAQQAGIIRHAGWTVSRRPARRHSVTAMWLPNTTH